MKPSPSAPLERRALHFNGRVQGLGFRPFLYRLARELGLSGQVRNSPEGVEVEIQGSSAQIEAFLRRLPREAPPLCRILGQESWPLPPQAKASDFQILPSQLPSPHAPSQTASHLPTLILPDLALCPACRAEILDAQNRRYGYPFTSCTYCGPRYSIISDLPYDRSRTSMAHFPLCAPCEAEYLNPTDRRFHAQPIACHDCGPQLSLKNRQGQVLAHRTEALQRAARALKAGQILALKGLGGFQLLTDARNPEAVQRLRQRKQRPVKPLAVLFGNLSQIRASCQLSSEAEALLHAYQAPIVLLPRLPSCPLAKNLAPGQDQLGVLLPYTPLHLLLMQELNFPVVCTSGNLSGEPLCLEGDEARQRLGEIADLWLDHNRAILRPVDDSVVQMIETPTGLHPQVLRRARGYAPLPLEAPGLSALPAGILALGGHLKNSFACSLPGQALLSQYLGDLDSLKARRNVNQSLQDWQRWFQLPARILVHDCHPDYASSLLAQQKPYRDWPQLAVPHHLAHILAVVAEHDLKPPLLGISFDGLGLGVKSEEHPDTNLLWGGEFLQLNSLDPQQGWQRVGHLRPFPLPSGERSLRSPAQQALGLLWAGLPAQLNNLHLPPLQSLGSTQTQMLAQVLKHVTVAQWTSSVGRLFDAMAALLGLTQENSFEAEAAMALEALARPLLQHSVPHWPTSLNFAIQSPNESGSSTRGAYILDWQPVLQQMVEALSQRSERPDWPQQQAQLAADFHRALAQGLCTLAQRLDATQVVLSGGCFQNRSLLELSLRALAQAGIRGYWAQQVPPNDSGLALGQLRAAAEVLSHMPPQ